VFAEYCRRYPPVQINIYRNFSYKVTEKLENGSIEVGFLTLPIQSPSLEIQPIFRDKLMLMVSPKNPLAKQKPRPSAISSNIPSPAAQDWPYPPAPGQAVSPASRRIAGSHGTAQHRHDQELCGRRPGVSIISASFARDEVAAGRVKLIDLEDVELFRELGTGLPPRPDALLRQHCVHRGFAAVGRSFLPLGWSIFSGARLIWASASRSSTFLRA
jgi:DNA-binding transcriptional LysR family regulator